MPAERRPKMPDIYFNCSRCTQSLVVDAEGIGLTVPCPTCKFPLVIPDKSSPRPVVPESKPDDSRSKEEIARLRKLAHVVRLTANDLECEMEDGVAELIARSSNGNEENAKWRLRRVLEHERSGTMTPIITVEAAVRALDKFFPKKPGTQSKPEKS